MALKISANLGFLWTGMSLLQAIEAAMRSGFDAVECHWPYGEDMSAVRAALDEAGLPMLSVNTSKGDRPGDFGLAALPDRREEARAAIEQAVEWASAIGARNIHVMAGRVSRSRGSDAVFRDNLLYACELAGRHGIGVLIEPLNAFDSPGYFLDGFAPAGKIVEELGQPNLGVMLDCYHAARMGLDPLEVFASLGSIVSHIQIASSPDRSEPDHGDVDYDVLLSGLEAAGYSGFIGAEYRPRSSPEAGLAWLDRYRALSTEA